MTLQCFGSLLTVSPPIGHEGQLVETKSWCGVVLSGQDPSTSGMRERWNLTVSFSQHAEVTQQVSLTEAARDEVELLRGGMQDKARASCGDAVQWVRCYGLPLHHRPLCI